MSKESTLKSEKYSYNSQNRLCESIVIDRQNKTQAVSYYGYDAFGRRVVVQDRDEACMRSLYDGFTFDVIKQSPTLANGMFVDSNETGIRLNRTGRATGDRYRYLDDDKNDGNRYFYLDDGNYKSVSSRYVGDRTSITVNGVVAAQNAGGEVSYFTTDLLGSVRSTTDSTGFGTNSYTYDVFGSLVEGVLSGATDYGYLGKQFDPQTGLYNYGYRDYAPEVARFTTVDPIRDGNNWFSYVNNDPVNFVDLWGLQSNDGVSFEYDQKSNQEGSNPEVGPDLNFFPKNQSIYTDVQLTQDTSSDYIVAGHGNPTAMYDSNGNKMTAKQVADIIKSDPAYTPGMTVWLYSCETGATQQAPAGREVFAQKVANELGQNTTVYAPETFLNVYNNGEVDISYDVPVIENGEVFYENPGNWNEFHGR